MRFCTTQRCSSEHLPPARRAIHCVTDCNGDEFNIRSGAHAGHAGKRRSRQGLARAHQEAGPQPPVPGPFAAAGARTAPPARGRRRNGQAHQMGAFNCGTWALGIKSGYGGGRFAGASPTRHQTRTRRCGRPGLARRGLPRAPAVPHAPHTAAPREVGAVPKRCAAKPARNENKLYNNAKRYFSVWPQI